MKITPMGFLTKRKHRILTRGRQTRGRTRIIVEIAYLLGTLTLPE